MRLHVALRSAQLLAKLRLVGVVLSLALAGACDLNPQPLPPGPAAGSQENGDAGSNGAGSGASSGAASSGSSSGSIFGSGSSSGSGLLLDAAAGPDGGGGGDGGASADAPAADAGSSEAAPSADAQVDGQPANDGGCVPQCQATDAAGE